MMWKTATKKRASCTDEIEWHKKIAIFDKNMCLLYNNFNKGAGRIARTYPFRRYVLSYRVTVQPFSRGMDGYFFRLLSLTSVMIAQIMMTKVNKSEYVTIACPPSARSRNGWQNRLTAPLLSILS